MSTRYHVIWLPFHTTKAKLCETGMNLGPPHMLVKIYDVVPTLQDFQSWPWGLFLTRMGCHFSIIFKNDSNIIIS